MWEPRQRWSKETARLRRAAKAWGAWAVRVVEASSAKTTSRTQCRPFSMDQCCRQRRWSAELFGRDVVYTNEFDICVGEQLRGIGSDVHEIALKGRRRH